MMLYNMLEQDNYELVFDYYVVEGTAP